jgi:hypothetical protein
MNVTGLSLQAQLAQASYSTLGGGDSGAALAPKLETQSGQFIATQAQQFAAKYSVVLQYNDDASASVGNGTSLSLTVFRDLATNQLTLAIRGTLEPADWITANDSIVTGGAAYPQIAALYNWWLRATATPGTLVPQYTAERFGNLLRISDVPGTGELRAALAADPDQRLDVTGHSLGGHLAMAFGAVFAASTASIASFNAPGFRDTATNHAFFAGLGGVLPSSSFIGAKTTNVIADEVRQEDVGTNPIDKLSPSLSTVVFDGLLASAADKEFASLEGLVGGMRALLGLGPVSLPAGNDKREDLYQAIKTITDSAVFASLAGKVDLSPAGTGLASTARSDFAALLALQTLSPVVLRAKPGQEAVVETALANAHNGSCISWLKSQASRALAWLVRIIPAPASLWNAPEMLA